VGIALVAAQTAGWGPYGSCTAACGGGTQTRSCVNSTAGCTGASSESCNTNACGTWGSWSECSCLKVGASQTRTCNGVGCPAGATVQACTTACVNCTVTGFSYPTQCTKQCGTGFTSQVRTVITDQYLNGLPCPILKFTSECNTQFCQVYLNGRGFVAWGPIPGPRTITYSFTSNPDNVDVFLFTADINYLLYLADQQRSTPFNSGYEPYRSILNSNNIFQSATLAAGTSYYLVLDATPVGAANGNNGVFDPLTVTYNVTGFDLSTIPPPLNTNSGARASASLFAVFGAVFVALFAIRA